ncbi:MAG: [FeFe] hydrogenase H-cluster radical SAM maturase HydE [Candidatus Omnitrophica bacterium]|nr:[FeFe] hydrogenase H-cluster radical SAM maturase HydE [Candidatus Omnitrophota bacterium]MCF7878494.1 [FeFe] hydrogenase H-cluster radical SAM maturase HydE [Candidatus Omnitrophota bacterium]
MCYAIPGKVKRIENKFVWIDYFGQIKKAVNELDGLEPGDYIYAQGGYAIEKLPRHEAEGILASWRETFFQLQELDLELSKIDLAKSGLDKGVSELMDKSLKGFELSKEEVNYLIGIEDDKNLEFIYKTANFLRQKYIKNSCCVHGIIEISNQCQRNCSYCGISGLNHKLSRYRMSPEEIIDTAIKVSKEWGFKALVLQSGEPAPYSIDELSAIIKKIKENAPLFICISFGEIGLANLEKLYQAGARGLLLRFETSNQKNYSKLHPGSNLENRIQHLKKAKELGYLIMTGGLIGLPGQSNKDLVEDIFLAKELGAEMYSFGPFLPHPDTPLAKEKVINEKEVLKLLALIRLVDPKNAKTLITTAFETLSSSARTKGLLSGANSFMLNVTPVEYRNKYSIYPNRVTSGKQVGDQVEETITLLKSLGRAPTDIGVV